LTSAPIDALKTKMIAATISVTGILVAATSYVKMFSPQEI